jgi:membrane-associated phospholipid phosphatase
MSETAEPASTPGRTPAAQQAARVSRRWPLVSGGMAVLLVAALGAIIAYRDNNLPFSFDLTFLGELVEHRSPFWTVPALVMNNIGGGIIGVFVVPIAIALLFLLFRMKWVALYFLIATILSAGLVQLLKNLYERPRPQDILVTADLGSFPSGHTANAATMAVVLSLVLRRVWIWAAGVVYTVIMLLSRTYLGAHWLSDTIGGVVLGSAVAVIVWAPLAHRLLTERERRIGPVRPSEAGATATR